MTSSLLDRSQYPCLRDNVYLNQASLGLIASVALFLLAVSLLAANWFLFLTGGLVVTLLVIRTGTEEEKLLGRFGEGYRSYIESTGRFLPRVRAKREKDS